MPFDRLYFACPSCMLDDQHAVTFSVSDDALERAEELMEGNSKQRNAQHVNSSKCLHGNR